MIEAKYPDNEAERLRALRSLAILDTDPERSFDDLAKIAVEICGTPIALVSLVDADRQWFKARIGLEATETPRQVAFCSHAILEEDRMLVVPDAFEDERFRDNPLAVSDPHVRFYAGATLLTPCGHAMGTLCVIDHEPRNLSESQIVAVRILARQVSDQLTLRRACLELDASRQALQQANMDLERFTSVAAHDLKEPLRHLVQFSELLREDLDCELNADAEQDLQCIEESAARMNKLVESLLVLSRTGSSPMEGEILDLESCVAGAWQHLQSRVQESGASLTVAELPAIEGDRTLMTQLFQNLIGNAIKYVGDAVPHVRITYESRAGGPVIGVMDNGIGIDPGQAKRVFTAFHRLHTRREYEGSGIGLAIAQRAVERHDGEMWVEPSPTGGCHFRFALPAARLAASVIAP